MKCCIVLFLSLFIFSQSGAQQFHSHQYPGKKGKLTVSQVDSNIFKIVFLPSGYKKNENLSDAVILKARATARRAGIHSRNDTVFINKKIVVTGVHSMNGRNGFYFPLSQGEKIYGGGERAISLNRRGSRLELYNNPWYGYSEGADNLNYSVPFISSSNGYGLFFDNPSRSHLDIGKTDPSVIEYGATSGEVNVYLILGDFRQVLSSYHRLTGTQPLPPLWAMGNLMSRFGYTSERQVNEIYAEMRKFKVPVDAIIYDLFWFGDSIKGTMGNLEWMNAHKWPDPKKMIAEFKAKGVQTILVTEPFFVETSKNYSASLPFLAVDSNRKPYYLQDFYFGKGGLIDIFRKDSRQWFWNFYKKQMDMGVEAWWGDLGEPEKHPADLYHNLKDMGHSRLFGADEVHNLYGHSWTKMLFENYAKQYPDKRLFSLNRSGFAGSQRYSIFPWTGDVSRNWSGYRAQLPVLLGMTMSGVPYVHSDAGGFAGGEGDQELYVRWLQFAAFTPIFRPHGTALYEVEPAAYSFPSEAALMEPPYREAAIEAVRLRYTFLPYNYTLAYAQATSAKPLMAPMYFHFSKDTVAAALEDQYMWGDDILVAPVLEKAAVTRKYYLPEGNWYHYHSGKVLGGKRWVTDSLQLNRFPLLLKEGSFVPVQNKDLSNTSEYRADSLIIWHLPSGRSSSNQLYHDDGSSRTSITRRDYQLTTIHSTGIKNKVETITFRNVSGMNKNSRKHIVLVIPSHELKGMAEINGKRVQLIPYDSPLHSKSSAWMVAFSHASAATKIRLFYK